MQHKIRWPQLTADVSSTHEPQIEQRLEEIPPLFSRLSVGVQQQQEEGNKICNSERAGWLANAACQCSTEAPTEN